MVQEVSTITHAQNLQKGGNVKKDNDLLRGSYLRTSKTLTIRERISMAEVIRRALDGYLKNYSKQTGQKKLRTRREKE